jgi:hypothetical protein
MTTIWLLAKELIYPPPSTILKKKKEEIEKIKKRVRFSLDNLINIDNVNLSQHFINNYNKYNLDIARQYIIELQQQLLESQIIENILINTNNNLYSILLDYIKINKTKNIDTNIDKLLLLTTNIQSTAV